MDEYVQGPLEVYKVSHHGSEDSHNPDLISYLNPQHCLVSVGENKFGHPSQKALDSLSKQNYQVHRTDEAGTIEVLIN